MMQMILALKDYLLSLLNSSPFSTDSLEGWIIICLCILMVKSIIEKAIKIAKSLAGMLLGVQVCYWLSFTGLNDILQLSRVFKYDLLMAVAQCFVGTEFCDWLLYIDSAIRTLLIVGWDKASSFFYFLR